jgi:hypothetical protein
VSETTVGRLIRHVPVLLRGRPLSGPGRYRPFFIVGSGSCGTTLLRAMLEAHPAVHIPPENVLAGVLRDYRRYSRLPWGVVLRIALGGLEFRPRWDLFGLPLGPLVARLEALPPAGRTLAAVIDALYRAQAAAHKPAAERWGDKTPGNVYSLAALRAVFPDLRVIHMVRDGRDVVRSFMLATQDSLPVAAGHWLRAVRAGRAFGARHPAVCLELRYEDLVRDPAASIRRVAAFLDLPPDERMLRHHEVDLPLYDVDRLPFLESVRHAVHQTAIGRWRTMFDAAQRAELHRLLGPTLAELGYEATTSDAVSAATPRDRGR